MSDSKHNRRTQSYIDTFGKFSTQKSPNNSLIKSIGGLDTTEKRHHRGKSDSLLYLGADIDTDNQLKSSIIEIDKNNETHGSDPRQQLSPSGR